MPRETVIPETEMDCVAEMETQCFSDPWSPGDDTGFLPMGLDNG
ncbi:MAG: hypothetical protein V8S58_18430 [Lachnospiraceae bacterium]